MRGKVSFWANGKGQGASALRYLHPGCKAREAQYIHDCTLAEEINTIQNGDV